MVSTKYTKLQSVAELRSGVQRNGFSCWKELAPQSYVDWLVIGKVSDTN